MIARSSLSVAARLRRALGALLLLITAGAGAGAGEAGLAGRVGASSAVVVGNLVYARTKTSKCFSDAFLREVATQTPIAVASTFATIRSGEAAELARVGFAIMTGEGSFTLTPGERANLLAWCDRGGFLLASASCSSPEWAASFRAEAERIWGSGALVQLTGEHPVFHVLNDLGRLPTKSHEARFFGVIRDGRLVALFSPEGLNDTSSVDGCCCCGGNEVRQSRAMVANALVYAITE